MNGMANADDTVLDEKVVSSIEEIPHLHLS